MKKQALFILSSLFLFGNLSAQPATFDQQKQLSNDQDVAQIKILSSEFLNTFHGPYTVSEENAETINNKKIPQISAAGGEVLNDNSKVGPFSAKNRVYATIYAKSGDEFIVIATPLKREKGPGARGTQLDHDHPAYQNLSKGLGFTGQVNIFGKDFIAKYDVIKDRKDNVVGAIMVAKPLFHPSVQ